MRQYKLGFGLLLFIAVAAMGASQADAQSFFFDFNSDSPLASGQGIGASQTVRADVFNIVTLTTVDLFAPEFVDDGTGNFTPTGNILSASAGDGVTTQTGGSSLGIDNPSVSDEDFFSGAGNESQDLNDGECWVVRFDADVSLASLNLSALDGGCLQVVIGRFPISLFLDDGTTDGEFPIPFDDDFISAGTNIALSYSAPASAQSANLRINSFTVVPAMVFDGVGDGNGDTYINFEDIPAFIAILQSGEYAPAADLNLDGAVDFGDIPALIAVLQG